jgi:3-oxoadipate enol-lactonase
MLGSLGSTLHMWGPQLPAVAERFRVVRVDARGHGRSPAPPGPYDIDDLADDALAVLDDLEVGRAHLVGLSLGGMTAMRIAAREPARVDRVVVMCTSARLGPPQMWAERAALVRADGLAAVADPVVARWLTPGFRAAHPDTVEWLEGMVRSHSAAGYAECCGVIEHMDLRPDLAAISAPLLAIAGAQDPVTPPEHLGVIAARVPNGRLVVVEDAAHLANIEQPATVSAAILGHLTEATRAEERD